MSYRVMSIALHGNLIASGSEDRTIRIWNASTGELQSTLSGHGGIVLSVCFSPDGKKIASSGKDKTVRIWDTATGAAVGSPLTGDKRVNCVAFSPDGNTLAAGDGGYKEAGNVRLFDVQTGERKSTLAGHSKL